MTTKTVEPAAKPVLQDNCVTKVFVDVLSIKNSATVSVLMYKQVTIIAENVACNALVARPASKAFANVRWAN